MTAPRPEKTCAVCGRRIVWRKAWARTWEQVKYCSDRCRKARGRGSERDALEDAILALSDARAPKTICPSDVARQLEPEGDWRALMEPVRQAARRLVAAGKLEITQGGQVVDASTAKGPIRLRRPSGLRGKPP